MLQVLIFKICFFYVPPVMLSARMNQDSKIEALCYKNTIKFCLFYIYLLNSFQFLSRICYFHYVHYRYILYLLFLEFFFFLIEIPEMRLVNNLSSSSVSSSISSEYSTPANLTLFFFGYNTQY